MLRPSCPISSQPYCWASVRAVRSFNGVERTNEGRVKKKKKKNDDDKLMVTWWYSSSRYLTDGHLFFTVLWLSYRLWWLIPLSYLMMILKNVFHGRMYMLRSAWLWFHESIGGMTISSHLNCFFDGTVLIVAAGRDYKNIILFFFCCPVFICFPAKNVQNSLIPSRPLSNRTRVFAIYSGLENTYR